MPTCSLQVRWWKPSRSAASAILRSSAGPASTSQRAWLRGVHVTIGVVRPKRQRSPVDAAEQIREELALVNALLRRLVAVPERHRPVFHGLVIHGDREGRADFILTAVAPADRPGLIVLDREVRTQPREDLLGLLGLAALPQQRQHRRLDGSEPRVETQHRTHLAVHLVLVVRVDEKGEGRAVRAGRRLDHERDEALARLLVEVGERLAAPLGVLLQVEVGPARDALELAPAERELVLHVGAAARVVCELVRLVLAEAQVLGPNAEPAVPVEAPLLPV